MTRHDQAVTTDPDQAVRVLEAHLGRPLAQWQRFFVSLLLTPADLWPEEADAEP